MCRASTACWTVERPLPDRAQAHRHPLRAAPGIAGVARSVHHRGICVWRILCRSPGARLPRRRDACRGAGADRQTRRIRRFRPRRSCCGAIGSAATSSSKPAPHRHALPISPARRSASRSKAANSTYVFTRAPNRGIAAVTIDGIDKGRSISTRASPNGRAAPLPMAWAPAGTSW